MKIKNYKEFLNEGISAGIDKARKALADGKKVFGRHTHPRLSGKEFEILSFSPTGGMAEVMWSDGKKPEDMASFSIDDRKIRIEESVNETSYDSYFMDKKVLGPNYKNSQLHIVAKEMFGKSNYMKLSKQQQAKVLATFPDK
jgi:hypothetical protein